MVWPGVYRWVDRGAESSIGRQDTDTEEDELELERRRGRMGCGGAGAWMSIGILKSYG